MQELFKAIRMSDFDVVKESIENNPNLVNEVATGAFDIEGKSPLQFAITRSEIEIARYLIEKGADVNFVGLGSIDNWQIPILHVAINKTIQNSRFPRREADGPKNDGKLFNKHLELLDLILEKGADITQLDSYGNLPIMRAVLDALNLDLSITDDELDEDIEKIFSLLVSYGADITQRTQTRKSVEEMFRNNEVLEYF